MFVYGCVCVCAREDVSCCVLCEQHSGEQHRSPSLKTHQMQHLQNALVDLHIQHSSLLSNNVTAQGTCFQAKCRQNYIHDIHAWQRDYTYTTPYTLYYTSIIKKKKKRQ